RHLERMQQEIVDRRGEPEAEGEARHDRDHADDQPLAQLDEVVEQRGARGLDLGFVGVVVAHESASTMLEPPLRLRPPSTTALPLAAAAFGFAADLGLAAVFGLAAAFGFGA